MLVPKIPNFKAGKEREKGRRKGGKKKHERNRRDDRKIHEINFLLRL